MTPQQPLTQEDREQQRCRRQAGRYSLRIRKANHHENGEENRHEKEESKVQGPRSKVGHRKRPKTDRDAPGHFLRPLTHFEVHCAADRRRTVGAVRRVRDIKEPTSENEFTRQA